MSLEGGKIRTNKRVSSRSFFLFRRRAVIPMPMKRLQYLFVTVVFTDTRDNR